jgi:hypothetical protein
MAKSNLSSPPTFHDKIPCCVDISENQEEGDSSEEVPEGDVEDAEASEQLFVGVKKAVSGGDDPPQDGSCLYAEVGEYDMKANVFSH